MCKYAEFTRRFGHLSRPAALLSSTFQFPISEMKRAAVTVVLSVGVATAYVAVMTGGEFNPTAKATTWVENSVISQDMPERPAAARRWRSSNAEQSLPTRTYFGPAPETKGVETYTADNSFSAPAAEWPIDEWWTSYGDEQLSGVITEALAGKPRGHSCCG